MHIMGGMLKPFVDSLLERNPKIVCITIFCSELNYILGIVCFYINFFQVLPESDDSEKLE